MTSPTATIRGGEELIDVRTLFKLVCMRGASFSSSVQCLWYHSSPFLDGLFKEREEWRSMVHG